MGKIDSRLVGVILALTASFTLISAILLLRCWDAVAVMPHIYILLGILSVVIFLLIAISYLWQCRIIKMENFVKDKELERAEKKLMMELEREEKFCKQKLDAKEKDMEMALKYYKEKETFKKDKGIE